MSFARTAQRCRSVVIRSVFVRVCVRSAVNNKQTVGRIALLAYKRVWSEVALAVAALLEVFDRVCRIRKLWLFVDFSACALHWSCTRISRCVPPFVTHGCFPRPSQSQRKRHSCAKAGAPTTVAHARRVWGAVIAVAAAASETCERSSCSPAEWGNSTEHSSPASARCLTRERRNRFLFFHDCVGGALKSEVLQTTLP